MTREKRKIAAEEFKEWRDSYYNKNKLPATMFIEEVIQILEQDPCDEAISRQAVDTLVDELARAISDERCCMSRGRSTATIMQDILDLPPVNPQEPKIGHWIRWYERKENNGYTENIPHCKCSECNTEYDSHTSQFIKYCNECGAKMVEPQESEDKGMYIACKKCKYNYDGECYFYDASDNFLQAFVGAESEE